MCFLAIAKRLASFKRKILRRIFGTAKIDNTGGKYNSDLENMFGVLDLVSFIRINRLKWIDLVNRMIAGRIPKSTFSNQPETEESLMEFGAS